MSRLFALILKCMNTSLIVADAVPAHSFLFSSLWSFSRTVKEEEKKSSSLKSLHWYTASSIAGNTRIRHIKAGFSWPQENTLSDFRVCRQGRTISPKISQVLSILSEDKLTLLRNSAEFVQRRSE